MTENKDIFDAKRFYTDLDMARKARDLNWKDVGAEALVNPSTLSRMANGAKPDANALAALSAWSGLNPANYVKAVIRAEKPDTLTLISSSLGDDPNLTPENAARIRETLKSLYEALKIQVPETKKIKLPGAK
jgi:transcriptional regulator with XRE-family HTH domain